MSSPETCDARILWWISLLLKVADRCNENRRYHLAKKLRLGALTFIAEVRQRFRDAALSASEEVAVLGSKILDSCISYEGELDQELASTLKEELDAFKNDMQSLRAQIGELGGWEQLIAGLDVDLRHSMTQSMNQLMSELNYPRGQRDEAGLS